MLRPSLLFVAGVIGSGVLLAMPERAEAQIFRPGYGVSIYRPGYYPYRPPGWDWPYIYPYSGYNLAQRYPYYPYPYPVYVPYPVPVAGVTTAAYNEPAYPTTIDTNQQVLVPHPTGELRQPPRDAAVIQIRVPDPFAQVWFNDQKSSSVGSTRWYVTPELKGDKQYHYEVKVSWTQAGQPRTEERKVDVLPGKTALLDFTRPAPAPR